MLTALLVLLLVLSGCGLIGFITFSLDMGFFWCFCILGDGIGWILEGMAAILLAISNINNQ